MGWYSSPNRVPIKFLIDESYVFAEGRFLIDRKRSQREQDRSSSSSSSSSSGSGYLNNY